MRSPSQPDPVQNSGGRAPKRSGGGELGGEARTNQLLLRLLRLEHALGRGIVEIGLCLFGSDLERRRDLTDQVDPGTLVHRALGRRQRRIAVAGGEVPYDLCDLVDVAALELLLVV